MSRIRNQLTALARRWLAGRGTPDGSVPEGGRGSIAGRGTPDDAAQEAHRYRIALERIRDYRADQGRHGNNEWSEAQAFRAVQTIAADSIDPDARARRVELEEADRRLLRRRVGALRRDRRYFLSDLTGGTSGHWVRFLGGDGGGGGGARVEVVGDAVGTPLAPRVRGSQITVSVSGLQSAPGDPLPPA
jgi:hypothetical protein